MSMKYPIIEDKILVALDSKYVYISKKVLLLYSRIRTYIIKLLTIKLLKRIELNSLS